MKYFPRVGLRLFVLIVLGGIHAGAFAQATVNLILNDGNMAESGQDPGSFTVT